MDEGDIVVYILVGIQGYISAFVWDKEVYPMCIQQWHQGCRLSLTNFKQTQSRFDLYLRKSCSLTLICVYFTDAAYT